MAQQALKKMETITKKAVASARPYFNEDDIQIIRADIEGILESGNLILGPYLQRLEKNFAEYIGAKYAVGLSSCTASLEIAMRFFGVKNREVIVPSNTFIACPNSVVFAGGRPVFSDIVPETYSMNHQTTLNKVTDNTTGVMAVHLGGLPILDIEEIASFCRAEGIFLIEDCSHAHGAKINGKRVGVLGDVGCFSLMATKIMTSGLGGIMTTNNKELYDYSLSVRNSASGRNGPIQNIAADWMMSEVTAAIGIQHLKRLDEFLKTRNMLAEIYMEELEAEEKLSFFSPPPNIYHSYYKFLATLDPQIDKTKLVQDARQNGIELGTLYEIPCNLQPVYKKLGYGKGDCPVAEEILQHQVTLPMHAKMTEEDVKVVVSYLRGALK